MSTIDDRFARWMTGCAKQTLALSHSHFSLPGGGTGRWWRSGGPSGTLATLGPPRRPLHKQSDTRGRGEGPGGGRGRRLTTVTEGHCVWPGEERGLGCRPPAHTIPVQRRAAWRWLGRCAGGTVDCLVLAAVDRPGAMDNGARDRSCGCGGRSLGVPRWSKNDDQRGVKESMAVEGG